MMELPPATWTNENVLSWAIRARLAPATITALRENQVDGPTLITLKQHELQHELGIASLPARRYLWDLVEGLRFQQETLDSHAALQVHQEEIGKLSSTEKQDSDDEPDAAGSGRTSAPKSSFEAVVNTLFSDAQHQRQIIEDHMLAHSLQREMTIGQQGYEDAEFARQEQQRFDDQLAQEQNDRRYAESLEEGRRGRVALRRQEVARVVPRSNAVRVNERAELSNATTAVPRLKDPPQAATARRSEADNATKVQASLEKLRLTVPRRVNQVQPISSSGTKNLQAHTPEEVLQCKPAAKRSTTASTKKLPILKQCSVCFEENIQGYNLGCEHQQCTNCMRKLFLTALGDNSLLPLRCCEIPIDMNIATVLLEKDKAKVLLQRAVEVGVKNKMYCSTCNEFWNLDGIDSKVAVVKKKRLCKCGTWLCIVCKTAAHPGLTCESHRDAQSGSDKLVLSLAREKNWKQCPGCSTLIELRSGCNHITCSNCRHEFCFNCLSRWTTTSYSSACSSGKCALWEEGRLLEAGEARVQQEEIAIGQRYQPQDRRARLGHAMEGLRQNEVCTHSWQVLRGHRGYCPNCHFYMYVYGMRCRSDCGSTVCYSCAYHRIPRRGWR